MCGRMCARDFMVHVCVMRHWCVYATGACLSLVCVCPSCIRAPSRIVNASKQAHGAEPPPQRLSFEQLARQGRALFAAIQHLARQVIQLGDLP